MRWKKLQKKNMMQSKIFQRVSFIIIVIALWQLIYILGVDVFKWWKSYSIPSPIGSLNTFINLLTKGTLVSAILTSMKRVLIGFLVSILIGIVLGFLIAKFKYLNGNLKPIILGLQTLPSVCWVPFAILWYGLKESAIIFVIVIGSSFSIAMSVENGIKGVEPIYIRAAKTMGAKERDLYLKVILPAAMPAFITGLKQGWSFAWRALMSGEMMTATIGLGQVLMLGRDLADINQVMVVMVIIVLIGTIIDKFIFGILETKIRKKMGYDRDVR